ncbi:MAG: hypothetical protein NTV03_01830 [Candidatus Nomurabacteria bacterium]|nr:hypothetical protein [Candidatus Nomurabacteria bacterium]
MKNNTKIKYNGGAAMMVLVVFFVFISLTILIGIVSPTVREYRTITDNFKSKQTYFLAESGVEDVVYRLKNSKKTTGTETLVLGDSQAITAITDIGGGKKKISTLGSTDTLERKIEVTLNTAAGVSLSYGVLVGQGGVYIDSGVVNGNLYSNGPISANGSGSNKITGTAISANSPALIADQTNGTGNPANNITFGNAAATQDVAQSFQVTTSSPLNKIQLLIKKTSTPGDITVKIMNDVSGNIGSTIFATGTLLASSVTNNYDGWINVSFTTNPLLFVGTTYWLVLDAGTSNTKYYTIGATGGNAYTNGASKIGQLGGTWNTTNANIIDYYFNIYLGGINGSIIGNNVNTKLPVGTTSGTAQAHTVNYVSSTGNIYCKSGTGNNKSCIDQEDPAYVAFPVSDANITQWKADALAGGIYNGNYTVPWNGAVLGPKKIVGDLDVGSGGLTVTGTIWVTGNIVMDGGGTTKLDPSYGSGDAVIVADGTITVTGGGKATGSGAAGSYLMLLALSNSQTAAMTVSGDAGAIIAYAPYGTMNVSGGSAIKEATAYKLNLISSSVTYEVGLMNNNFSSGPSGTWNIDSWKEVE